MIRYFAPAALIFILGCSSGARPEDRASGPPSAKRSYLWAKGIVRDADGKPMSGVDLQVDEGWDTLIYFPPGPRQFIVWGLPGHSGPSSSGADGRFEIPFTENYLAERDSVPFGGMPLGADQYDWIAEREHTLHLWARAPDGRVTVARIRSRPVEPPEVEITLAPWGRVLGRVVASPGLPPVDGVIVCAVFRDPRPGRYDYFVDAELKPDGGFEVDLEPGAWRLHLTGLPSSVVTAPSALDLEVEPGSRLSVEIRLASRQGFSGTLATPSDFGVAGATLRLLEEGRGEVDRIVVGPTPLHRDTATGAPAQKGFLGARTLDVAASPTPFRFAAAQSGKTYSIVLEPPGGSPAERFGPFTAPAADLKLRSSSYEPAGVSTLVLRGIDPLHQDRGKVILFRNATKLLETQLAGTDGRDPAPELAFLHLPPGEYRIEVTVRNSFRDSDYLRGTATFEVRDAEKKAVEVKIGGWGTVEVIRAPEMRISRRPGIWARVPEFSAIPIERAATDAPASPISGYGSEDEAGPLRFGLPPGAWSVYLPCEREAAFGEPHRAGTIVGVVVEEGKTTRIREASPLQGKLSIDATQRQLETRYLGLSGRTADGLPFEVENIAGASGRFEIAGLPRGEFRLILTDRGGSRPPLVQEVAYHGVDLEVKWATPEEEEEQR